MNNEKIYKTMSTVGAGNLALGIVVLVTGIIAGTMMVINGASLLARRKDITF